MLRRASLVVLLALAGSPAPAAATVDGSGTPAQATPPAGRPTFAIAGRGWGHGVGMSQYGALGFALRGTGYARILAHYYRGTVLGPAPLGRVRVLLADGLKTVTVGSPVAFRVRDGAGKTHALAAGKHTFGPGLSLRVDIAERPQPLPGPLLFLPGAAPLELRSPYRGQLRVSAEDGKLRAVNIVGLEQYLYGVVPSEVPYTWPVEALKAQAVAARSYALSHLRTGDFDLFSDVRSQVYRGLAGERSTTNAAVDATAGEVVLYEGEVASTFFFSTSGGRTMSAADGFGTPLPYLLSVPDPYDTLSPYHQWGPLPFTQARLAKALGVAGRLLDVRTTRNQSGRAAAVVAEGTGGGVTVTAAEVRRRLGLRSTWFDVGVLALAPETPGPVTFGARVVLAGTARGLPAVVLEERRAGAAAWAPVGSVAAEEDGAFRVAAKPLVTTRYRLKSGSVAGAAAIVSVAPLVRFYAATSRTALRGLERPVLAGTTVAIQRLAGTVWRTVATATVDERGDFEARLQLVPGSYRARFAPGRGFVPGTSKVLKVLGP